MKKSSLKCMQIYATDVKSRTKSISGLRVNMDSSWEGKNVDFIRSQLIRIYSFQIDEFCKSYAQWAY